MVSEATLYFNIYKYWPTEMLNVAVKKINYSSKLWGRKNHAHEVPWLESNPLTQIKTILIWHSGRMQFLLYPLLKGIKKKKTKQNSRVDLMCCIKCGIQKLKIKVNCKPSLLFLFKILYPSSPKNSRSSTSENRVHHPLEVSKINDIN